MEKSKEQSKITFSQLFLGIIYLTFCTFIFLLVAGAVIDFIFDGRIIFTRKWMTNIGVGSIIAGIASGLGSWIFAKIDERKARRLPPSGP